MKIKPLKSKKILENNWLKSGFLDLDQLEKYMQKMFTEKKYPQYYYLQKKDWEYNYSYNYISNTGDIYWNSNINLSNTTTS